MATCLSLGCSVKQPAAPPAVLPEAPVQATSSPVPFADLMARLPPPRVWQPESASPKPPPPVVPAEEVTLAAEPVQLPTLPPLYAVSGTRADDVWLLGGRSEVFHYQRGRVVARERVCPQGPLDDSALGDLLVAPESIVVLGFHFTGTDPERAVAVKIRGQSWQCRVSIERVRPLGLVPGAVWFMSWNVGSPGVASDGGEVPVPQSAGDLLAGWLGSRWHGWMATSASLWELCGGSWFRRPSPAFQPVELLEDDRGRLWALGSSRPYRSYIDDAERLAYWNGHEWIEPPLPREFAARRLMLGDPQSLVLVGQQTIYRYHAGVWQKAPRPLKAIYGGWHAPEGVLWLVGANDGSSRRPRDPSEVGAAVTISARSWGKSS